MPFLSEPGSLPWSVLRTTNGFGFRASACVVDFNVKWRRYAIIIDQNWTISVYVALVLKESTAYIQYKFPHICEELVHLFKYY